MNHKIVTTSIWVLLLANLIFFVWAQGFLTPLGFGKYNPSEPQRLERQIHPERMSIQPVTSVASKAVR